MNLERLHEILQLTSAQFRKGESIEGTPELVDAEEMVFWLWEDKPPVYDRGLIFSESRAFASRRGHEILPEFHDMAISGIRQLKNGYWIQRVQ